MFALRILSAIVAFLMVAFSSFLHFLESRSPIYASFAQRAPCGPAHAINSAPDIAGDWDVNAATPIIPYFYPPIASRHRDQGTATVSVCILIDGSVADSALKKSSGSSQLDSAALFESGQWRFVPEPDGINGKPEWKDVSLTFSIPSAARNSPSDSTVDLSKSAKPDAEETTRPTPDPAFPHGSRYSTLALRHNDQGNTVVFMMIGADGWVTDARVDQSSGSNQLDAAALISVGYWHYFPATRNGRPVAVPWQARVVFRLSDGALPGAHPVL